jgi:iron complex transport system ATP-binding protein
MTMHDLNQALRYADRFIFLKDGQVYAHGDRDIVTPAVIQDVYGVSVDVVTHKGLPLVVPVA